MSDWPTCQLRRAARFEYGDSLAAEDRRPGDIAVYGSNGRIGSHDVANSLAPVIIIGRKGSFGTVQWSTFPVFAIDTTYYVDRRHTTADLRWLYHVLCASGLDRLSADVGVPGLSRDAAYETCIPFPPVGTQRFVARYLDDSLTQIDEASRAMLRLKHLLSERRRAAYRLALSGNWLRVTLRYVARLGTGHTPSRRHPEYWVDCTIPWMSLADVWQIRDDRLDVVSETAERISPLGLANSAAVQHPAGTVMLSRTASVGFSAIMGVDMATTQDFFTWTCSDRLRPEYLLYVLRASRGELGRLTMGSTHKTIYMPDIEALKAPLPPIEEQDRIVARIRAEVKQLDALTANLDRQLALLAEHREALITAAVTGQIDVTREAPPPPEEALEPA